MCGIVGLFYRDDGAATMRRAHARCATCLVHRGPDDGGNYHRGAAGPRPPAPEHHRSRRRPPADARPKTAASSSSTTARSTTTRSCAASSRAQGAHFRTHVRHRGDPAAARARTATRAVARLNGIFAYALWDDARSAGCCWRAIAPASSRCIYAGTGARRRVRLGDQGAVRVRNRVAARSIETRVAEYLLFRQVAGHENPVRRRRECCRPATRWKSSTAGPSTPRALLVATRIAPRRSRGDLREAVDALDAALERRGLAPAHGRRAARARSAAAASTRASRRAIAARHAGRARSTRFRWASTRPTTTRAHTRAWRPRPAARTTTSCASTKREYAELLPQADLAPRPAAQLRELRAHLRGEQAGAPARDGGAHRRRRGRAVRRLSALLHPAPRRSGSTSVPGAVRRPADRAAGARAGSTACSKLAHFARRTMRRRRCSSTAPAPIRRRCCELLRSSAACRLEFRDGCVRAMRGARPRRRERRWRSSTSRPTWCRS